MQSIRVIKMEHILNKTEKPEHISINHSDVELSEKNSNVKFSDRFKSNEPQGSGK